MGFLLNQFWLLDSDPGIPTKAGSPPWFLDNARIALGQNGMASE